MGIRINTNTSSSIAQRNLQANRSAEDKTMSHISSGSRIVQSGEDAAGFSVSTTLNANMRSTQAALRNANDGISMVQIAEGGLSSISEIIVRIRELGVQAASDTINPGERRMINREVQQLASEIGRVTASTDYQGKKLLGGGGAWPTMDVQVGIHSDPSDNQLGFNRMKLNTNLDHLGLHGLDFSTKENARELLADIDQGLATVSTYRATLGSLQSRFMSVINGLGTSHINLSAAFSRIKDSDLASETSDLSKSQILSQASTAVLSQANALPNMALKLLET